MNKLKIHTGDNRPHKTQQKTVDLIKKIIIKQNPDSTIIIRTG